MRVDPSGLADVPSIGVNAYHELCSDLQEIIYYKAAYEKERQEGKTPNGEYTIKAQEARQRILNNEALNTMGTFGETIKTKLSDDGKETSIFDVAAMLCVAHQIGTKISEQALKTGEKIMDNDAVYAFYSNIIEFGMIY